MTRTCATILGPLLALGFLAACGDPPPATAPPGPADADGGTELVVQPGEDLVPDALPAAGAGKGPLTKEDVERQREESHARAMKLIESFRLRAYDPVRVSGLHSLGGTVTMTITTPDADDRSGRFTFAFDAEQPSRQQTKLVPAEGADSLPASSQQTAYRYAAAGFRGGYFTVINHLPATLVTLFKAKDGKWGVYAPPDDDKSASASYLFDDNNLIVTRGNATLETRNIEYFDWEPVRGQWLLDGSRVLAHDTTTKWTYLFDERDVVLPERVTVTKGKAVVDLVFHYDTIAVQGK